MNNPTLDPKVKQIRDKLRDALIERIPQLIEHLDKLPPEEYVKYYFMIAEVVESRKAIAKNNK
jgi:hypothetical protein